MGASNKESHDFRIMYRKIADYCAENEHCLYDIKLKLLYWKVDDQMIQEIVEKLKAEKFVDERRYAEAFARGKFRNLKWGKIKIRYELKNKRRPETYINQALAVIDPVEYNECLRGMAMQKIKSLGGNTTLNRQKTIRYLVGKGFEAEFVVRVLGNDEE
jgi:regulatory protein